MRTAVQKKTAEVKIPKKILVLSDDNILEHTSTNPKSGLFTYTYIRSRTKFMKTITFDIAGLTKFLSNCKILD